MWIFIEFASLTLQECRTHTVTRSRIIEEEAQIHIYSILISLQVFWFFSPKPWPSHPPLFLCSVCFPGSMWCSDLRIGIQRTNALIKKACFTVKCQLLPSPTPPPSLLFSLSFPLTVSVSLVSPYFSLPAAVSLFHSLSIFVVRRWHPIRPHTPHPLWTTHAWD